MVLQAAHNAANNSDGFQVTAEVMKEATAVINLLTSEKLKLLGETLEQVWLKVHVLYILPRPNHSLHTHSSTEILFKPLIPTAVQSCIGTKSVG